MPSPSTSGNWYGLGCPSGTASGQPSSSVTKLYTSGCSGQRSSESDIPSWSRSVTSRRSSGHPSRSSTPLKVSGWCGHRSIKSGYPSESASAMENGPCPGSWSGQPSWSDMLL